MKRPKPRTRGVGKPLVVEAGSPIFARPIATEWMQRNAPSWPPAVAPFAVVDAVTLAEVRWPGGSESQFGVGVWLDEGTALSESERQALADRIGAAVRGLPPEDKVVLFVDGALAGLFRAIGEPVFVRDAARFTERLARVRAQGGVHMAREPFTSQ